MPGGRKFIAVAASAIFGAIVAGVFITSHAPGADRTVLLGAVLEAASDPHRQMPLPNAEVTATSDSATSSATSDVSGQFRLVLTPRVKPAETVTLKVQHAGYQPWEIAGPAKDQIYIARLTPLQREPASAAARNEMAIGDLRVRYSVKASATINVGSFARTFAVPGGGGVPCEGSAVCSPDGRWKAASGTASYDAGDGNEFREVRVSCIAGPC